MRLLLYFFSFLFKTSGYNKLSISKFSTHGNQQSLTAIRSELNHLTRIPHIRLANETIFNGGIFKEP